MKCPRCNVELVKGEKYTELNGTEATPYTCPQCEETYMDVKIPYSELFGSKAG